MKKDEQGDVQMDQRLCVIVITCIGSPSLP